MGKFTIVSEQAESASRFVGPESAQEKQSPSASDSVDEPFTLEVKQPKRRKSEKFVTDNKEKFVNSVVENPANYALWSQVLIGSANTVVVTWLGAECAMEKREADMMEPPLSRMLARMPVSASQKVSVFIDPMVIMIALGMWANRIIRVQKEKSGNNITTTEFERASGITRSDNVSSPTQSEQISEQTSRGYPGRTEPDIPQARIEVHPNGVPVAIAEQTGDL